MDASIRAGLHEKNRWNGKAMFTANQESRIKNQDQKIAACGSSYRESAFQL